MERENTADLAVDGRRISRWILGKYNDWIHLTQDKDR
jgi:hypothetical protein